jgi:mono/diheme cytochrome c family protein/rhodanese-related sulfurtransferase
MRKTVVLVLVLSAAGCARKVVKPTSPLVDRGGKAYAKYCATCHGVGANGYAADNAPSLRSATFLASATDEFLRAGILRGRPGTAMAAYGRGLGGPLEFMDVLSIIAFLREGGPAPRELPAAPVPGNVLQGKAIYESTCLRCHGTKTQRSSAVHLANPIFLETASDAFLRVAIEEGRPPTSMVPWKGALGPAQIDAVVAYLRSMAVTPAVPAPPPPAAPEGAPLPRRKGPIVLNPRGRAPDFVLKEDRFVSIDQVKKALDDKRRLVIADARAPSDWLNLHIKGAISTPYYDTRYLDDIPNNDTWVVAYCACPHHVSGQVVDELRKRGYKHTAVIDEGIFAWQQKGYPVVAAPGLLPSPAPPPARR